MDITSSRVRAALRAICVAPARDVVAARDGVLDVVAVRDVAVRVAARDAVAWDVVAVRDTVALGRDAAVRAVVELVCVARD